MTSLDFSTLTNVISSQINSESILSIMGTVVGATVGIFLVSYGAGRIVAGIQYSLKYGKISDGIDYIKEGRRQKYYSKHGKLPNW